MSFIYNEETESWNKGNIFISITMMALLIFMINPFQDAFTLEEQNVTCYQPTCIKTTLDNFDKCVDIGYQKVGFLSGNYYYLCDGIKVTKKCLEYGEKRYEGKYLALGTRCEKGSPSAKEKKE